ncbi:sigma-54-dependent Fis family transcriptional regulator [uncultured Desulfosarcina sp.]|uniref:sigma-54-dependent Fis family transcriptional regulator n=1 Tax=uncultured Desulfosarcina sp. TaxID=218289 RepID=UPI0029C78A83|nr:sigma-54-dependent Fis family transcriptional regulator [uncultured Desulfosarcina sp.]
MKMEFARKKRIDWQYIAVVATVIGSALNHQTFARVFDLEKSEVNEVIGLAEKNGCLKRTKNAFKFCMCPLFPKKIELITDRFQTPVLRYLLEIKAKKLDEKLISIANRLIDNGIAVGDVVLMINEMGNRAKSEHRMDHALIFYNRSAAYCMAYRLKKNLFVRCVLSISKLDFMRGMSPLRTLELQKKALSLVNESNLTAEDALLMLYAGIGMHFAEEEDDGFLCRKRGDDYLKQFENEEISNEALPLIGWHFYLQGNFEGAIAYYETMILAIENRKDVEIIAFAYPPIIFSYIFLGELNRALVLNEIIYKHAMECQDYLAATLMYAISGRVHLYMHHIENARTILYKAYAECLQEGYGWGKYYTLFGLCLLHLKEGKYDACRETLVLAGEIAKKHNFRRINASPFVLEALRMIEIHGLAAIEGMRYEDELQKNIRSNNVHLAGVSYRHMALLKKDRDGQNNEILDGLKRSIDLLHKSGNQVELGKSYVELARFLNETGDRREAECNAQFGWQLLGPHVNEHFPNELRNLVKSEELSLEIGVQLETSWLELRHIINPERLVTRLLTSLSRIIKVESAAVVTISSDGLPAVLISQNIQIEERQSVQYQRMLAMVSCAVENRELIVSFNENVMRGKVLIDLDMKPGFILCVPFFNQDKVGAVLYLESYYKNTDLSETDRESIRAFEKNMSPHLFAILDYGNARQKEISGLATGSDVGNDVLQKNVCPSTDETVNLLLSRVRKIAGTDVPVLFTGESGVGKEVFAKELYMQSRQKAAFIKVNCGAIPESLIESELFGYERGSFTGANQTKKGYFEVADNGTILFDEIGELSLLSQVKLLRVLQEREITRIGGTEPIKVNFRLIAATNKDLREEVERGAFRLDLYYRLNVLQLEIPPLRKRKSDIPGLAKFFVEKHCRNLQMDICKIHPDCFMWLLDYDWPGNVRELENVMQKAVLLTDGNEIRVENLEQNCEYKYIGSEKIKTLEEMNRDYIKKIIGYCNGKIGGADGAAALLDIKRTTLISRMKKYGII